MEVNPSTARAAAPLEAATLRVNEIFLSAQGETRFAGLPCLFVRLTGCPLRCSYCDTAYAFTEGETRTLTEIQAEVLRLARAYPAPARGERWPLVELTGGEPLAQPNALPLLRWLCDAGFTVLLETSGAFDIGPVDPRVHRIVDLKCPSSGESARNRWENLALLKGSDEVKFVIGSRQDYEWAKSTLMERGVHRLCPVLFSCATPPSASARAAGCKPVPAGHEPIDRRELVERLLRDALPVRFQVQLHKEIWPPERRGV